MWTILDAKRKVSIYRTIILSVLALDMAIFCRQLKTFDDDVFIYDASSLILKSIWILLCMPDVYPGHGPTFQEKQISKTAVTIPRDMVFYSGIIGAFLSIGRTVVALVLHEEFSFMARASCFISIFILLMVSMGNKFNTNYLLHDLIRVFTINFRGRDAIIATSPMILKNMAELTILCGGTNAYLTTVSNPGMINNESAIIIAIEFMRCVTNIVCSQLMIPARPFPGAAPLMNPRRSCLSVPFTLSILIYRAMSQCNGIGIIMVAAHLAGTLTTYQMLTRNHQDLPIAHSPTVDTDAEDSMEFVVMMVSATSTAIAVAINYQDIDSAFIGWWIICGINFVLSVLDIPSLGHKTSISQFLAENLNESSRIYDELVVDSLPDDLQFIARFGKELLQQHFPFVYVCSMAMFYLSISSKSTPTVIVPISTLTLGFVRAMKESNKRDRVRMIGR